VSEDQQNVSAIRELRLALVCYGGVSLAVYMHGMTKELRKLVVASRAFEQQPDHNPFAEDQTEGAYFEQLAALADDGTAVRVVIDVISGTSAGGINGVCLAKALASDGSDAALRDLWLSRGDIGGLVNAPRWLPLPGRVAYAVGRLASQPKAPYTPLRGDDMARWLYDAISRMSTSDSAMSAASVRGLMPAGHPLRLFVTTTDLTGYERIVESGAGEPAQHDRSYRHVLQFVHEASRDSDFDPQGTAALALAARCTSSFPGAFPPVRLKGFADDLSKQPPPEGRPCDLDGIVKRFFPQYLDVPGKALAQVWATAFVDGGVLDNAPFDHAIEAIAAQRAETEVIRHLLYIEPDPGPAPAAGTAAAQPSAPLDPVGPPGWLSTVWRVRTTIPWQQPLLAQLLDLRNLNARIRDIGAIAEDQMPAVEQLVTEALREAAPRGADQSAVGESVSAATITRAANRDWLKQAVIKLHGKARELAGLAYGTYARLKIEDAVAGLADQVAGTFAYPPDSSQASFVRSVLIAWAQQQGAYTGLTDEALQQFLGPLDMGYRERRLRFVAQGVNLLYGTADAPPRPAVDRVKKALYDMIEELHRLPQDAAAIVPAEVSAFLNRQALAAPTVFADPADWARAHADELAALVEAYATGLATYTKDSGGRLWEQFLDLTDGWTDPQWMTLATRYAGFPVWDTLIFPIVALSGIPQFSPIHVRRFSPLDASALNPGPGGKLKGRALAHFAAFFHREWRENDYLWGRLDAAELILAMLTGLKPRLAAPPHNDPVSPPPIDPVLLGRALNAVLRSETDLTAVTSLRQDIQQQVTAMLTRSSHSADDA